MVGKGSEYQNLWPNGVRALPGLNQESLKAGLGGLSEDFWVNGTPWMMVPQCPTDGVYNVCGREKGHRQNELRTEYLLLSGLGSRGEMIL